MTHQRKNGDDPNPSLVHTRFGPWERLIRQEVSRMLAGRYAPEDVDDVVQDSFAALLAYPDPADDGVVIGAARFAALRFLEKQPPNEVLESDLCTDPDTDGVSDQEMQREAQGVEAHRFLTVVTNDTPESLLTAADAVRLMRHIGHELPPGMFEAFCAVEVDGLGLRRVSKELGVDRRTIAKWVRECRNHLEKRLSEMGVTP